MKANLKDIRPGKGIGTLLFGISRDEVKSQLGEPSELERYSLSELDQDNTESWHYDDLDLSLSFDEENEWKLSSIAVSCDEYTLEGLPLVGRSKEEIVEEFRKHQWGEPEEDEEVGRDSPGSCLMHVDKSSISLWFENDELTEVQIGPFYENDEIIWPHKG